jgi:hypothetical protein
MVGDRVLDLGGEQGGSLRQALADGIDSNREGVSRPLAGLDLLPVIPDATKVFCIGLNYATTHRRDGQHPAGLSDGFYPLD